MSSRVVIVEPSVLRQGNYDLLRSISPTLRFSHYFNYFLADIITAYYVLLDQKIIFILLSRLVSLYSPCKLFRFYSVQFSSQMVCENLYGSAPFVTVNVFMQILAFFHREAPPPPPPPPFRDFCPAQKNWSE